MLAGQAFGALLDCLVGFLVWVGYLVNGSIGYWIHSSVVWCDSGSLRLSAILWSVGRLVGQALGGLFGRSVGCSDSPRVVSLVDRSIVWSSS